MSLRFESDRGMPEGRIARGVRSEYSIWFNNNPGSVAYRQWHLQRRHHVPVLMPVTHRQLKRQGRA